MHTYIHTHARTLDVEHGRQVVEHLDLALHHLDRLLELETIVLLLRYHSTRAALLVVLQVRESAKKKKNKTKKAKWIHTMVTTE